MVKEKEIILPLYQIWQDCIIQVKTLPVDFGVKPDSVNSACSRQY